MDRTSAITRLNTEEIATEVNNVIKKGLDKLLGDHLYRYELLEKTHDAIMNLPSVRNHLNLPPQQYNPEPTTNNVKYEQMIEKLLKRIDELTFEVNQLKQTCKKESTDVRVDDELKVVKLEQKENIRLEIEEAYDDASDSDDEEDTSEAEEESVLSKAESSCEAEEEEDATVASLEEENICSECDCKVILDEDIVVVDGKKYCGACDPTSSKEEESEAEEEEVKSSSAADEEEEVEEEVATVASLDEEVKSSSAAEEADDVETEKSESVASASEAEAEAEEEEEFIEIDIDDVTYCTNNEENGFIYELTEDGDVGEKVGYLKDGEPFFYADEK